MVIDWARIGARAIRARGRAVGGMWTLTLVALAVGTDLVGLEFQQTLNCLLVLGSLTRGRASRHDLERSREIVGKEEAQVAGNGN